MSRVPSHHRLLASLLDRLIEIQPNEEATSHNPQGLSLSEMQANVLRDVQSLLNTRQTLTEPTDDESHLRQSVVSFGLPDISNVNPDNLDQRDAIRSSVEEAIRQFEPRLANIRVQAHETSNADRSLRLTVDALLKVEPNPVPVQFDTVIESGTSQWKVK
ncbi:Gene 25-like lysozyme [Anatilimnocola aggregata]|uniref:Gene 25-like lysozyme n=1 Tax=Anatilimnocola aggregata TaxID=2528021 RepID=A0A517YJM5_9BACT|nr:type VI secretion system baseplate subunit TssE [Anatilimnocola aggregata]QDU30423.1 Gene 25-like lysozyme [Anatilimnocola aggregata]